MKFASLCVTVLLAVACSAQTLEGSWQASVEEHGVPVRYVLHISRSGGRIAATLDTPESFVFDNAVDTASVENSTVHFRAGLVSYDGSL